MSDQAKQDQTAYFGLINGLARFLSREEEHGYVFATADYQPLESEIKWKLSELLGNKGKKLVFLRLEQDPDRSIRTQIEDTIAKSQPDALLIQGVDELMPRDVTTGELTSEGASFVDKLNYAREALNELGLPIVFWLSRRNLTLLGNRAADLFAQRRRSVFFFTYQPELEADTPLLQSRFREEYRNSEDYKQLRLQVNLLESQLKEAKQKGYPARRIAREIALPLAAKYSELDLQERAAELLDTYDEAFDPTNPQLLKQLVDIAYKAGKYAEAERYIKLAMGQLPEGERTVFKADLLFDLGDIYSDIGQLEKALEAFGESRLLMEALIAEGYDGKRKLAVRLERLGTIHQTLGQFDKALDSFLKVTDLFEELFADNPHNEGLKNGLAISYEKLGEIYKAKGQFDKALDFFLKERTLQEELYDTNPHNEGLKNGLAISYSKLGDMYQAKGQFDKALDFFLKRSKLGEELFADNPHNEGLKKGLAISYGKLGDIYQAKGQFDTALDFFLKVTDLFEALYADNPYNVNLENGLAISYYKLAELYRAQGSTAQAKEYYERAIEVWEGLYERTRWGQIGGYLETVRERVAALGMGNT